MPQFTNATAQLTIHPAAHNIIYDVKSMFGAVGNGVTNDATAIAAAFAAVPPGGIVFFPPGTYICNSEIDISTPCVVMGAGNGASLLKRTSNVHALVFSNVTGTTVRDLAFETAFATGHRSISIYIGTGCVGFTIDNCRFINQSSSCIGMSGTGIKDVRITNCQAIEVWEQFLDCVATDVSGLYVAGNSMRSTTASPDFGVKAWFSVLEPTGTTGTIEHVRYIGNHADFTGMSTGNLSGTGGIGCSQVATNGVFRNIVIDGNSFRRMGSWVKVDTMRWGTPTEGGGITITGNNFEQARLYGIAVTLGATDSTYEDSCVIVGNMLHGPGEATANTYDGVYIGGYGNGGIVVNDNVIKRHQGAGGVNYRYGVNIGSANVARAIVRGNYIGNATTGPIGDSGSNNATFGNHRGDSTFAQSARVIATASLPAAAAAMDGSIVIEDAGAGDRNLIVYAGGQRFRIDGGANV